MTRFRNHFPITRILEEQDIPGLQYLLIFSAARGPQIPYEEEKRAAASSSISDVTSLGWNFSITIMFEVDMMTVVWFRVEGNGGYKG